MTLRPGPLVELRADMGGGSEGRGESLGRPEGGSSRPDILLIMAFLVLIRIVSLPSSFSSVLSHCLPRSYQNCVIAIVRKCHRINKGAGKRIKAGQTDKEMGDGRLSPLVNWWAGLAGTMSRAPCELVDRGWQGLESNRAHTRLHVTNQSLPHLGNF